MNQAPGAGSVAWPVNQPSSMLPLYHGCPLLTAQIPSAYLAWHWALKGNRIELCEIPIYITLVHLWPHNIRAKCILRAFCTHYHGYPLILEEVIAFHGFELAVDAVPASQHKDSLRLCPGGDLSQRVIVVLHAYCVCHMLLTLDALLDKRGPRHNLLQVGQVD